MQNVLPDAHTLARAMRDNPELTFTQVAAQYGVSRQAVSQRLSRADVTVKPKPVSLKSFIPWKVLAKHDNHLHVRMLRLYARRALHQPVPASRLKNLQDWEAAMRYLGLVVTYDRDTVNGFSVDEKRSTDQELWRP